MPENPITRFERLAAQADEMKRRAEEMEAVCRRRGRKQRVKHPLTAFQKLLAWIRHGK